MFDFTLSADSNPKVINLPYCNANDKKYRYEIKKLKEITLENKQKLSDNSEDKQILGPYLLVRNMEGYKQWVFFNGWANPFIHYFVKGEIVKKLEN